MPLEVFLSFLTPPTFIYPTETPASPKFYISERSICTASSGERLHRFEKGQKPLRKNVINVYLDKTGVYAETKASTSIPQPLKIWVKFISHFSASSLRARRCHKKALKYISLFRYLFGWTWSFLSVSFGQLPRRLLLSFSLLCFTLEIRLEKLLFHIKRKTQKEFLERV